MVEDATRDDMNRAVARLKAKVKPDSVVMLFFGGYGIQAGPEKFDDPGRCRDLGVDVRRDGISVEFGLDAIKEQGAEEVVVLDASRLIL